MPTLIYETPRSREGVEQYAGASLTREWCVLYEPDFTAAVALVELTAEVTFFGLERKQILWRSLGAPDLWLFTVEYGSSAEPGALRPEQFSPKLVASTTHITQSLRTLNRLAAGDAPPFGVNLAVDLGAADEVVPLAPDNVTLGPGDVGKQIVIYDGAGWELGTYTILASGATWQLDRSPAPRGTTGGKWNMLGTAPDCHGAIGQSLDTVQGCDIVTPGSEVAYSSNLVSMTEDYYRLAHSLVGKTNNAPFRGFPAGTLLYLGFEPTSPNGTLPAGNPFTFWNLAHSFKYEPDVFNVTIGDIVVPRKGGHEYLWARYTPVVPMGTFVLTQKPTAVYIEQVYYSGDMTLLGIDL